MKPNIAAFSTVLLSTTLIATNQTGMLDGIPVITSLNIAEAPQNAVTRYWFLAGVAQGTIPYYLPVLIARGGDGEGKTVSLSSTVHGDELTGIRVVQTVFEELDEYISKGGELNGAVIGVPTVNINGIEHNQRNFYSSSENGFFTNLNRIFPGKPPGSAFPDSFVHSIWNNLWNNASQIDVAVDLHTLSIGMDGPMWAYADYRAPYVARLAQLFQPDIIKVDPGEPGSLESTWVQHNVPAITLELGPPKQWNKTYSDRGHAGVFRLLKDLQIIPSTGTVAVDLSKTYQGDTREDISCTKSGFAVVQVGVLADVQVGQILFDIYNSWGDIIETVKSPWSGRVLQSRVDPAVEQGAVVVVLVFNATASSAIGDL